MYELGQKDEALPLMSGSSIYGGIGSDEASELSSKGRIGSSNAAALHAPGGSRFAMYGGLVVLLHAA